MTSMKHFVKTFHVTEDMENFLNSNKILPQEILSVSVHFKFILVLMYVTEERYETLKTELCLD